MRAGLVWGGSVRAPLTGGPALTDGPRLTSLIATLSSPLTALTTVEHAPKPSSSTCASLTGGGPSSQLPSLQVLAYSSVLGPCLQQPPAGRTWLYPYALRPARSSAVSSSAMGPVAWANGGTNQAVSSGVPLQSCSSAVLHTLPPGGGRQSRPDYGLLASILEKWLPVSTFFFLAAVAQVILN